QRVDSLVLVHDQPEAIEELLIRAWRIAPARSEIRVRNEQRAAAVADEAFQRVDACRAVGGVVGAEGDDLILREVNGGQVDRRVVRRRPFDYLIQHKSVAAKQVGQLAPAVISDNGRGVVYVGKLFIPLGERSAVEKPASA